MPVQEWTKTIGSDPGDDYSSLVAAEADISSYAFAGDTVIFQFPRAETLSLGTMTMNDTTLGASGTFKITVAEGMWHQGRPGSGAMIQQTGGLIVELNVVEASAPTAVVERLEILGLTAGTTARSAIQVKEDGAGSQLTTIRDCIGHGYTADSTGSVRVFQVTAGADNGVRIENCLVYDVTRTGTGLCEGFTIWGDGAAVMNCTAHGVPTYGFREANTTTVRPSVYNCLALDCGTDFFASNAWHINSANNGDSDGTAPGANAVHNLASADQFYAAASGDFRLKRSADFNLRRVGADLHILFADDLTGRTRHSPWSRGAYAFRRRRAPLDTALREIEHSVEAGG